MKPAQNFIHLNLALSLLLALLIFVFGVETGIQEVTLVTFISLSPLLLLLFLPSIVSMFPLSLLSFIFDQS